MRQGADDADAGDMTTLLSSSPSTTRPSAVAAYVLPGAVALGMTVFVLVTVPRGGVYDGPEDHVADAIFVAFLVTSILGAAAAYRDALAPRLVPALIGAGYGLVCSAVVAMSILRHEPSWFIFLAGPGQLLAIAGFATWAVWGRRRGGFSWPVALLCGLGGLTAIIGSEAGLTLLIVGFWFSLAARSLRDQSA